MWAIGEPLAAEKAPSVQDKINSMVPAGKSRRTSRAAAAKSNGTPSQRRLGSRLKKLKAESDLTWDTIARESHVSRRWLFDIADGKTPSKATRKTLAEYFGRTLKRRIKF
jgi:hypothetical protein